MGTPEEDREKAAQLPTDDVVRILLEQHARIRQLFEQVGTASAEQKQRSFDDLRVLLAVHETAEEMVLRPISEDLAGKSVADARNQEEAEATRLLKELERLDVASAEFSEMFATLRSSVEAHAEAEEHQEFPQVLRGIDQEKRIAMGSQLRAAESLAPTHPHPSTAGSPAAQAVAGPFAALVDRARDLFRGSR